MYKADAWQIPSCSQTNELTGALTDQDLRCEQWQHTLISVPSELSQCTLLSQYKTRYSFYRWVGWCAGGTLMPFSLLPWWDSNWCPLDCKPKTLPESHQSIHSCTHTHAHIHTFLPLSFLLPINGHIAPARGGQEPCLTMCILNTPSGRYTNPLWRNL